MTEHEIRKKIVEYSTSNAPIEVKSKAIKALQVKLANQQSKLLADIEASAPDLLKDFDE